VRRSCSFGAAPVVHAQVLAMGNRRQSDPKHCLAIPERIILHDLRFQANSDKIDKFSVPVLDYTIQIIKENPEYLVYVRVRSSIPTKATSIPTLS
jgi:hypothetical protein